MTRTRWQAWSWTAWMAVFGLVCAPTLSHAMSVWQGQGNWIEVCSAQGTRRIAADPGEAPVSPGADLLHHLSHCPLCGLSGAGLAPPPAEPQGVAGVAATHVRRASLSIADPAPDFRCDAQPRAPPAMA